MGVGKVVQWFGKINSNKRNSYTILFKICSIWLKSPLTYDCSHEIQRCLLLGKKAIINLDGILKSRNIILLTKVCIVKAMVFPVVMFGCKSWTLKKAECQRIDAFELWCWRRLLRVPWTAMRSNQLILQEINPEYSLEVLMLKLHYFGHLIHWKRSWCWARLTVGGEGGNRGWDGWVASLTQWTWLWANSWIYKRQESLACCSLWGSHKSRTLLSDWITFRMKDTARPRKLDSKGKKTEV